MDKSYRKTDPLKEIPSLLFVAGVDGVGKTTISKWIVSELQKKNLNVDLVWSRFNNYLSIPLLAFTRISGHNYYRLYGGIKFGFHDFESLHLFKKIFFYLQLIDVNIATYFKIFIKIKKNKIVVCERGPWDTLVDVISDTGMYENIGNFFSNLYTRQIAGKHLVLYIKRSYKNIILMRPELVHDKKLAMRISLYDRLAEENDWFVIDNNSDINNTKKKIKYLLKL